MGKQLINVTPTNYENAVKEFIADADKQADLALQGATALVINNDDDLKAAKEDFTIVRSRMQDLEAGRRSVTGPLNDVVKAINALFKGPADKFERAKRISDQKAIAYEDKRRREQEEAERKAREEAAREEARRKAEKERQEREWREKEEKARREAEEKAKQAKKAKDEAERARLEAEAEKARQDAAKAQEKADQRAMEASEVFVAPKQVEQAAPVKVAGTKRVERWFAVVVDESKIPMTFAGRKIWKLDESALNDLARSLKTKDCPIPGVRFESKVSLS